MTMTLATGWSALLFAALVLAVALYVLSLSGHFPSEHRGAALRGTSGTVFICITAALSLASLAFGLGTGWSKVPWYALIIAGGTALLAAPLVLMKFPDQFVNGRGALAAFSGITAVSAAMLYAS
jgi:uncharacterized membrane protein YfcA